MRKIYLLLLSLILLPYMAVAETGAFTVTGDSNSYTYTNGVLTVNDGANITISMTSGATEPTNDRIVVAANATATITLAGVNITPVDAQSEDGNSGIDLGSGTTLNITLQSGSSNEINGGTSAAAMPAPGIHVPENSTLTIDGDGSLQVKGASGNSRAAVGIGGMGSDSENGEACGNVIILGGTITVHGGTATTSSAPVDIGGGATDTGKGGDCNTVIILTSVNSGEGLTIGGGKGLSSNDGSDGTGIKPIGDGTYTVYGDLTLPCDITIPQGATVVIPEGASLTVPEGVTLTNNGTIQKEDGGSFINDGTVTGQQPADDRYTINYAEETITIAEGYDVYTAEADGEKIENNSSITAYIGKSLYIQKTGSETTGRTEISIPERPEAPTVTATIDYDEEKLSFSTDVTATNLEYALSQSDSDWKDVPSSAALSEMGWDGNAEKTYYFRTGATDASFASSATTTSITAPARPEKPAAPTTVEVTSNSITIKVVFGQEYRLGSSGDWETLTGTTGSDGQTVYTYDNLNSGTEYTIETRYKSGQDSDGTEQFASHPASVTVTTKNSAGAAPTVGAADVTDTTITLPYDAAWEYSTDQQSWSDTHEFTGLTAATQYTYYVRVAETETAEASEIATVTVWTAYAAPAANEGYAINYATETLTVNEGYEVNTAENFTGTAIQSGASLSDCTGHTLYIRHTGTQNGAPASVAVVLTIPARPAAPTGLTATEETCIDGKDGKITGVTTDMEYKLSTASEWTPCTGTTITHLAPGTYQVRTAATDAAFAGEEASITIEEVVEIQIDKSESSIELGSEGVVLTATITGIDDVNKAENWKWESSNKDIADVIKLTPPDVTTRSDNQKDLTSTARVTPVGEGTATITVIYDSPTYHGEQTYTITVKAKEEEPTPKPDPTPIYYNIQFEEVCEGVDASLSKSVVKAGNQVSVYIEVEEGYDAENLKVMCKQSLYGYWEEIEEGVQPGEYIIYNVYTDIYVKVEGVEKIEEDPTGMSDIESTKVYSQNGDLYVYTSQPQEVAIITMNGTILKRERQEGLRSYPLPKGVYIICIGEERYKIAVR